MPVSTLALQDAQVQTTPLCPSRSNDSFETDELILEDDDIPGFNETNVAATNTHPTVRSLASAQRLRAQHSAQTAARWTTLCMELEERFNAVIARRVDLAKYLIELPETTTIAICQQCLERLHERRAELGRYFSPAASGIPEEEHQAGEEVIARAMELLCRMLAGWAEAVRHAPGEFLAMEDRYMSFPLCVPSCMRTAAAEQACFHAS